MLTHSPLHSLLVATALVFGGLMIVAIGRVLARLAGRAVEMVAEWVGARAPLQRLSGWWWNLREDLVALWQRVRWPVVFVTTITVMLELHRLVSPGGPIFNSPVLP